MTRALLSALLAILITACSHDPVEQGMTPGIARGDIRQFAVDARFSLKMVDTAGNPTASSGRLRWTHRDGNDQVLLSNPLGVGLAEIWHQPGLAELRTADGETYRADAIAPLIAELTGHHWPVDRLPDWLLGRPGPTGRLTLDSLARPSSLEENHWRIDYFYDTDAPEAFPARLNAFGENTELRLRVETWTSTP